MIGQSIQITLVDDDHAMLNRMTRYFDGRGYRTRPCLSSHELFYSLQSCDPSVIVVDWILPGAATDDVVRRLRQVQGRDVAIVVHSTLADPDTAICALASGADDFVTKSDSFAVLDARIHAILRRFAPVRSSPSILSYGSYSLSLDKSELTINSEVIDLTPREFDLAWMFFSSPSRLLRKYDIIAAIWGKETTAGEHTLAQHIYSLRRKCGFERHGFRLTAVYGIGYRLDNMPTDRDESLLTRSPLTATDR